MLPIVMHAGLVTLWLAMPPPPDVPKVVAITTADEASLVDWERV